MLIAETLDKLAGMGLDKTQMAQLTPHLAAWREAELARVRALLETGDQWRAVFDIALRIETGAIAKWSKGRAGQPATRSNGIGCAWM